MVLYYLNSLDYSRDKNNLKYKIQDMQDMQDMQYEITVVFL